LLALILIAVPTFISLLGRIAFGADILSTALDEFVIAFVTFFVLLIVVFLLGMVLDVKKARGKFLGLFSALALLQIIALVVVILSILTISFAFSPEAVQFAVNSKCCKH